MAHAIASNSDSNIPPAEVEAGVNRKAVELLVLNM